jgi:predicted nuclease of predicted toxin-antitoxin system
MKLLHGFPPKVIWLQIGNCTTNDIETTLRQHHTAIIDFANDTITGVLVII